MEDMRLYPMEDMRPLPLPACECDEHPFHLAMLPTGEHATPLQGASLLPLCSVKLQEAQCFPISLQ